MYRDNFSLSTGSKKSLAELGKNIKYSRMVRRMTQKRLCNEACIARSTLQLIEKGCPGVAIGNYAKILEAMGMENHLLRVASYDNTGIKAITDEILGRRRVR